MCFFLNHFLYFVFVFLRGFVGDGGLKFGVRGSIDTVV